MGDFVLLYSHCIIVQGAGRAAICDLQRHDLYLIPNGFADLFSEERYYNLQETLAQLDEEEQVIIEEYTAFLEQKELACYCTSEEIEHFPALSQQWLFPSEISNCILDTNANYEYFTQSFLRQLNAVYCYFIQFRLFGVVKRSEILRILSLVNPSPVKSVEFMLNVQDWPDFEHDLIRIVADNPKISRVVIAGANESKLLKEGSNGMGTILCVKEKISDHTHCGIIDSRFFSINITTYTESLHHNTCLNRKISIDQEGNIKNCPSLPESFGNINDTTLAEAISKPGFKKYWNITKDQIAVCKDCEFRHICTDCRAYLENPQNEYSKPLKCGYNPYTCEWEEWSTHPLKQKAIRHYVQSLF